MRPDVVCLGETMALIAPDPPLPLSHAQRLVLSQAGAESNVAISLARLGTRVQWCSRLGDDVLGRRVAAEVAAAGAGTELVAFNAGAPTGLMLKDPGALGTSVLYYRAGSAASTMDETDVERALAPAPRLLHLSGITAALSASCSRAVDLALDRARGAGVEVSVDVNFRAALWPDREAAAARLRRMAQGADLVFVGMDEANVLWGTATAGDVRSVLDAPRVLVIKDGERTACSFEHGAQVVVAALPVDVLEPVGAGDAFAAGWLHGYLTGMTPVERLRLGHLAAAAALGSVTDHGGGVDAHLAKLASEDAPWPPTGSEQR
jgi:2-dehydro-3-deoxygluconokinase